jgi:hypothetical protein
MNGTPPPLAMPSHASGEGSPCVSTGRVENQRNCPKSGLGAVLFLQ